MVASSQVACLSIDNFMFTCYTTYLSPQTTMDNRHQSTPPCDLLISHHSSGVGWPTKHLCEDTLRVLWGQGSPHVFINTYTMYIYIYIYMINISNKTHTVHVHVQTMCSYDMHWYALIYQMRHLHTKTFRWSHSFRRRRVLSSKIGQDGPAMQISSHDTPCSFTWRFRSTPWLSFTTIVLFMRSFIMYCMYFHVACLFCIDCHKP